MKWIEWYIKLESLAASAERRGNRRAARLRGIVLDQRAAAYRASRWSGGSASLSEALAVRGLAVADQDRVGLVRKDS